MMINNKEKIKNIILKKFKLSDKNLQELEKNISLIKLDAGEKFHLFGDDIPGVLIIQEGEIRLIGLDKNKEPFTIAKYFKNQIVGAEQILGGNNNFIIAASSKVKAILIPADIFLNLAENEARILESFSKVTLQELFLATSVNENANLNNPYETLKLCKGYLEKNIKIKILENGENFLDKSSECWLISSCNIENLPQGSLIKSPMKIKVNGQFHGRIIPVPENWPLKFNNEFTNKSELENSVDIHKYRKLKKKQLESQKKALEDRYGRFSEIKEYPHSSGSGPIGETLACIRMLSQKFDLPFRKDLLKKVIDDQLKNENSSYLSILQLACICELIGLRSSVLTPFSSDQIKRIPTPSITLVNDHPIVIWEQKAGSMLISDPLNGQKWIDTNNIFKIKENEQISILFTEKSPNSPNARFGLKWFLPAFKKHRSSLIQVVVASFFVQLLGLFNPLLIQQIIDAVIAQGNLRSLNVLGTLLVAMALAQAIISSLRTYLFADTTNRMDISLGAKIIHHLLRLPLSYFSKRAVGEVSSRINELEKIRSFLTGTALTVVLDSVFSVIYIGVMLTYSVKLTFFALAVIPFFILLTLSVSPIIRKQLRVVAVSNARVSSHLVETLSGMETVKGQGMELQSEWQWEKFYGRQIQAGFKNTITSTGAGAANNFLQQISSLIVIWAGALIVLEGKMSIGQLIAFRILSGYVTGPLLRLASLWQNFQEMIISIERLSDIVDHKEETEIAGVNLPPLKPIEGNIKFKNVNFSFNEKGPLKLLNINFEIEKGSFIGIVGSSGSGKSTLLKLLARFYDPTKGSIYVDDQDTSKIDLYSLRSQIGLVPQDCFLFDGSVQDNIASSKPDASIEEIKDAAKIACADQFIEKMESGYSSSVGERGSNLSGGQRQRIALARMILMRPKLLILDEATSALDIDTETKLLRNLANTFKDKTVLFISHRLSSLTFCDQIIVMHQGLLVEKGKHFELMNLNGRYATLFRQQGIQAT